MPSRRDLLRTGAAGLAASATAAVAGCGFHSPSSLDHAFTADTDPAPSAFDCDGHAVRLTVDPPPSGAAESGPALRLRGQLPSFDPSCERLTSELVRGPEGLYYGVTVAVEKRGWPDPCDGTAGPVAYSLTSSVDPTGLPLRVDHVRGESTPFETEFEEAAVAGDDPAEAGC
ncbi:hypothetical protein [Halobaculum rubrum]|uniref:hypothetical protein n=1 Tax=Halobaculum rubrum TaxID=2872158 RepID=UPI001CA4408F|nr:hypothetical protein [Halobaculum rubrum]QZX98221.1 hypothetical protein K6T25_07835 [Halobaculum rubrum]